MGMGEPLANFQEVVKSIKFLTGELYFGFSRRRVTVSTVGVVEGIFGLKDEDLGVNLSFSLHAPTQEKREKIIPFARKYPLPDILQALDAYRAGTGRDITYEYVLLAGYNDSSEDACALAELLRGRKGCSVNLIPYNPISGVDFATPSRTVVEKFHALLEDAGLPVTCRYKKGDDIAAACGQLALNEI
jgi:23S rRNA (adenine2503-C2)-methyltransferase